MERLGFIQDMMDVKVLLLFVAARLKGAATVQELYELAYQDERLSYFDVCTAVPELVRSGHLQQLPGERYAVTEKGRTDGAVTEDSLAFPVKQRAQKAVEQFNREQGAAVLSGQKFSAGSKRGILWSSWAWMMRRGV